MWAAGGVGLGLGAYAWKVAPYRLEFVERALPIPRLSKAFQGKRLIQISDMHVGNRFPYSYLMESMQKAGAFKPEIVVYTGDFVSYENEEQISQLQEVMRHGLYGSIATLGILGNHDYGKNWSQASVAQNIINTLENQGVQMLRNEQVEVHGLQIAGADDLWAKQWDIQKTFSRYDFDGPGVVLCHNPDACDLPGWGPYEGYVLSGHTHGGQCKPPFLEAPLLPVKNKKYSCGDIQVDSKKRVYINRALGCSWPVRFNVRPEITVFTLIRG